MTRINCIPPQELTDRHLVAEYRELPRVFRLIRKWQERPSELPQSYTMGKGHVRFFYNKALWLMIRQQSLIAEMIRRGMSPQFRNANELMAGIDRSRQQESLWTPTYRDQWINRERIKERLDGR